MGCEYRRLEGQVVIITGAAQGLGEALAQRLDKEGAKVLVKADHIGTPGKVEDISFEIKEGELIGFAGLLGSGRTETAEMLFCVDKPTKGTIQMHGAPLNAKIPLDAINSRMAFCPEDRKRDGIIGDLSIRENIALAVQAKRGFMHPMSRKEQDELANKYIKLLAIATPDAEKKIGELSGGNQQKVILGRWLTTEADILIMDNPTQGIDVGAKAEIYKLILELAEKGKTILVNTLEIPEIQKIADRCVVFYHGHIQTILPREEITEERVMLYATNVIHATEGEVNV